jgi:meso-butanediol dehydrogenase/(S,S)-butanediol dehydrogenase/diacetyl reductase
MRLKGKVALITGGGSGIGRATSRLLSNEGAKLVIVDIDESSGNKVADSIKAGGGSAVFQKADVSRDQDARKMVERVVRKYGRLDILFNNAGIIGPAAGLAETAESDWDRVMDINLKGVYLGCKHAIPEMVRQGGGVIINTASATGITPIPKSAVYNITKAAVINLTKTIAVDYGPSHIRANCVCPGVVETEIWNAFDEQERILRETRAKSLVGRNASAEDIARSVLYLASDESQFVQGSALVIDGGLTSYQPTSNIYQMRSGPGRSTTS